MQSVLFNFRWFHVSLPTWAECLSWGFGIIILSVRFIAFKHGTFKSSLSRKIIEKLCSQTYVIIFTVTLKQNIRHTLKHIFTPLNYNSCEIINSCLNYVKKSRYRIPNWDKNTEGTVQGIISKIMH